MINNNEKCVPNLLIILFVFDVRLEVGCAPVGVLVSDDVVGRRVVAVLVGLVRTAVVVVDGGAPVGRVPSSDADGTHVGGIGAGGHLGVAGRVVVAPAATSPDLGRLSKQLLVILKQYRQVVKLRPLEINCPSSRTRINFSVVY